MNEDPKYNDRLFQEMAAKAMKPENPTTAHSRRNLVGVEITTTRSNAIWWIILILIIVLLVLLGPYFLPVLKTILFK